MRRYLPHIVIAFALLLLSPIFLVVTLLFGEGGPVGFFLGAVFSAVMIFMMAAVLQGTYLLIAWFVFEKKSSERSLLAEVLVSAIITTGLWFIMCLFLLGIFRLLPGVGRQFFDFVMR